jgi:hypothetical protein
VSSGTVGGVAKNLRGSDSALILWGRRARAMISSRRAHRVGDPRVCLNTPHARSGPGLPPFPKFPITRDGLELLSKVTGLLARAPDPVAFFGYPKLPSRSRRKAVTSLLAGAAETRPTRSGSGRRAGPSPTRAARATRQDFPEATGKLSSDRSLCACAPARGHRRR